MAATTHPSPTPLATLWWTSADGQGFYDMGEHEIGGIAARDAAVDAAEAELLEQVGDNDAERAAILAGAWSWTDEEAVDAGGRDDPEPEWEQA